MKSIVDWFETIPLLGTTAIVAGLSGLLALAWTPIHPRGMKLALAFLTPFVVSYCIYWTPVWMGSDASGYGEWAFIIVFPWGLAGAATSLLIVLLVDLLMKRSRPGASH